MIDVERARRDAENGSTVAVVALMVHVGEAGRWPQNFRDAATAAYSAPLERTGS